MCLLQTGIAAVELGYIPDFVTRSAIRRLCGVRLRDLQQDRRGETAKTQKAFIESMQLSPIAPVPSKANEQHYELPPEFFASILGPHRKYSCCLWRDQSTSLEEAEEAALRETCDHAQIADGQNILELGCGWGALSLWMAQCYPRSRITAVSNSVPQRRYIEARAAERGLANLKVITADMNQFSPEIGRQDSNLFDRVVSVEMFEHMRNYELLLGRIAFWLKPSGKLFVHIFCHRNLVYPFETHGAANWMGRYFFTGGMMPSADLLHHFNHDLEVTEQWTWNGRHYQRTAEAWLARLDAERKTVLPILKSAYGSAEADRWFHRWRMFFLAVSELFGYSAGDEWIVSHYLMQVKHVSTRSNAADDTHLPDRDNDTSLDCESVAS